MPRGGKRTPKIDPETGLPKKMGRPKSERPTNANVAGRVLAQAKAEQLWGSLIELERRRLGINKDGTLSQAEKDAITGPDYRGNFSIIPLTNLLRYLEDRHYGRPMDTVNHLHDKPLEVNATLSLGEGMRLAMAKADERLRKYNR
jgi:hypothetical protein